MNAYCCDDWWRLLSTPISSTLCCSLFVELKSLTLWHAPHISSRPMNGDSTTWIVFVSIKWMLACNFFRNVSQVFSALPTFSTTPQIPQNPTTSPENSYYHCIQRQCQLHAQPACWKWPDQIFFCKSPRQPSTVWQPRLSTRQLSQRGHLGTEAPLSSPRPAPSRRNGWNGNKEWEENPWSSIEIQTQRIHHNK